MPLRQLTLGKVCFMSMLVSICASLIFLTDASNPGGGVSFGSSSKQNQAIRKMRMPTSTFRYVLSSFHPCVVLTLNKNTISIRARKSRSACILGPVNNSQAYLSLHKCLRIPNLSPRRPSGFLMVCHHNGSHRLIIRMARCLME